MTCNHENCTGDELGNFELSRRKLITAAATVGTSALLLPIELLAASTEPGVIVEERKRFPCFQSTPVSYPNVKMQDTFWAPRQKTVLQVSVPWSTRHLDTAGGLDKFKENPHHYVTQIEADWEAVEFIESLATVVGLQPHEAVEGLTRASADKMI